MPLLPILYGAVAGEIARSAIQNTPNVINKGKTIINNIKNNYDISDYEAGFSIKDNKIITYDNIFFNEDNENNEEKEEQQQTITTEEEIKPRITEYINMETMATVAAISFFVYSGYKIIIVLDKYID